MDENQTINLGNLNNNISEGITIPQTQQAQAPVMNGITIDQTSTNSILENMQTQVNQQAQAQVVVTTTSNPINSTLIFDPILQNNMEEVYTNEQITISAGQSIESTPDEVGEININPISTSELKVKTAILREFITNVKSYIGNEDRADLSTIVQMIFNSDGLEVRAVDGLKILLFQYSRVYSYSVSESFCISKLMLSELINKINEEDVIFKRDELQKTNIHLLTSKGDYIFTELVDPSTNEDVKIELYDWVEMSKFITLDKESFREFTTNIKIANSFIDDSIGGALNGVYIRDNFIIGASNTSMDVRNNIAQLKDDIIFIPNSLVKVIYSISFGDCVQIGLYKAENEPYYTNMVIKGIDPKTDKVRNILAIILMEPEYYEQYTGAYNSISNVSKSEKLNYISVKTNDLYEALDRVGIFINDESKAKSENKVAILSIVGNTLQINSKESSAKENIALTNLTKNLPTSNLNYTKLKELLSSITCETIEFKKVSDESGVIIIPTEEDFRCISLDNA